MGPQNPARLRLSVVCIRSGSLCTAGVPLGNKRRLIGTGTRPSSTISRGIFASATKSPSPPFLLDIDLKLGKTMRTHVALDDKSVDEVDPVQLVFLHAAHRDSAGRRSARHRIPSRHRAGRGSFTGYSDADIGPGSPLVPRPHRTRKYLEGQPACSVPCRFRA